MHVDPVRSEDASDSELGSFPEEQLSGRPDEAPARYAREGLPKRFRMRHGRHYVDELLGDTPLRTVREIPISEIEPPSHEALDLEPLEGSIRRLGVLEPLLVARRGLEYRVVAGMRRLRAARTVGLSTVPCLVQDIDEEKEMELRDAVSERLGERVPIAPAVEEPPSAASPASGALQAEPLQDGESGSESSLRRNVMSQLAAAESLRAKTASAVMDMLSRPMVIERAAKSSGALVADATASIALEARLRGVHVDATGPGADDVISIDGPRCRTVLIGLLQAILSLVDREGTVLEVRARMTSVRPALIVDCRLRQRLVERELQIAGEDAISRFFDPEWREHPCGADGAQALGALQRIARAHGGRVQASHTAVTVVIPRPLEDF